MVTEVKMKNAVISLMDVSCTNNYIEQMYLSQVNKYTRLTVDSSQFHGYNGD